MVESGFSLVIKERLYILISLPSYSLFNSLGT